MAKRGRPGNSPYKPLEGPFSTPWGYTEEQFNTLSFKQKKQQILWEQEGCCDECKMDKWMGKLHKLELHHTHGRSVDNPDGRWNLVYLCPNCHSQKPGYRGEVNRKDDPNDIADTFLKNGCKNLLKAFQAHGYSMYGSKEMQQKVRRIAKCKRQGEDMI